MSIKVAAKQQVVTIRNRPAPNLMVRAGVQGPPGPQGPQGEAGAPGAANLGGYDIVATEGPADGDMFMFSGASGGWDYTHQSSITDGGNF